MLGGEVERVKAVAEPPHSKGRADRLGRRSLQRRRFFGTDAMKPWIGLGRERLTERGENFRVAAHLGCRGMR